VAAGGSVLALAAVSATADAAAHRATLAPSDDPIFALIEDYRTAEKAVAAAASELSRREEMLIEQGLGSSPFISVLEMRDGLYAKKPVTIYKREYVDIHIPPDRFRQLNADAHIALDAKIEQHKAIMGDSEDVLNAAQDLETESVDALVSTTPTTMAGVIALLELWPELRRARVMDDDQADTIIISVIDALDEIHPDARLA